MCVRYCSTKFTLHRYSIHIQSQYIIICMYSTYSIVHAMSILLIHQTQPHDDYRNGFSKVYVTHSSVISTSA